MLKKKIGHIVSGSLEEGLLMRIDASTNPETIKTGKFVCIVGTSQIFFFDY